MQTPNFICMFFLFSLTHRVNLPHVFYVNRYYNPEWLLVNTNRIAPHQDEEVSNVTTKCLNRYFPNSEKRRIVNTEFAKFSAALEAFSDYDSLRDRIHEFKLLVGSLWVFSSNFTSFGSKTS